MIEPQIERKQFIAGAVCPECQIMDRLVVEVTVAASAHPALSRRRCVACGFADPFSEQAPLQSTGGIPRGKPERPRTPDVSASPVTIVDPKTGA